MNTNGHEIGRREFLLLSSTCALAAVTVGPRLFAESSGASLKRLAVGFVPLLGESRAYPAAELPAGDGRFISRGARVSVSGASGSYPGSPERRAVELVTHYSYFEGSERREAPFLAWGCNRRTRCQGNSIRFTIPVDEDQKIRFSVGVEAGPVSKDDPSIRDRALSAVAESHALPVTLSLLSEPDSLKLVPGHYVIAMLFENDVEPVWSDWQLRRVDGRLALTDEGGTLAPFEHLVVSIDLL